MFTPHSPQVQAISSLFGAFVVLAAVVFLFVAGLVTFGMVRYRARAGVPEPRPTFGSRTLEITWTAIPLMIVTVLFVFTVHTMASIDAPLAPTQPPDVMITGHQWWWEARYPGGADTANEIHIPTGRRLLARIESADVIHDFWVAPLARKMDAVPGRTAYVWLEADAPGTYSGTCSEFCGMQHAWMRFRVIAEPEPVFSAWLRREGAPPTPLAGQAAEGARIFNQQRCGDCHTVSPADMRALSGPPLTHIASRRLLGGEIPNTRENLTRWILTPQSIKPGNKMMNTRLAPAEVTSLSAYLESLR